MRQNRGYYPVFKDAFILLDIEGSKNGEIRARVPNVAVEITRGCQLTLEWDKMFAQCVISLGKLKAEEQLCIAAKVNIMHIQRLQDGLNC